MGDFLRLPLLSLFFLFLLLLLSCIAAPLPVAIAAAVLCDAYEKRSQSVCIILYTQSVREQIMKLFKYSRN